MSEPNSRDEPYVECVDLYGQIQRTPRQDILLRPAAYAIVLHEAKILLLKMKATGKYHLPGGGIEAEERLEETLRRELHEETGIEIVVQRFVHFEEIFFYNNPSGRAYHGLHFYYLCNPASFEVIAESQVMDSSAEKPSWVPLKALQGEDFQVSGEKILELCHRAREI